MNVGNAMKGGMLILLCAAAGSLYAQQPPATPAPHLLVPPKADDIVGFADDVKLPSGTGYVRANLQKERVLEFLTKGDVKPDDSGRGKWIGLADLSLPDNIASLPEAQAAKKLADSGSNGRVLFNALVRAGGALVTKDGNVFFFKLWNDRVLGLRDESGNACLLVLGQEPESPARFLQPCDGFEGENARAQMLYGQMQRPKVAEVIAFANHPQSSDDGGERYHMDETLMMKFLARGVFNKELSQFDESFDPFSLMKDLLDRLAQTPRRPGEDRYLEEFHRGQPGYAALAVLQEEKKRDVEPRPGTVCDGVMATRDGQVYFWKLRSNFELYLMDAQHRTTMLRLDKSIPGVTEPKAAQFCIGGPGMGYRWFTNALSADEVLAGPDWTPGRTPTPFSSAKAVQIAWKELAAILTNNDTTGWQVDSITTGNLYGTSYRKWYYKISFSRPGANVPQGILTGVAVYVDMHGKPAIMAHE